jgi:hypothetical protein
VRVFDDGSRAPKTPHWPNLWFELEPGKFWCGSDHADALECKGMLPLAEATEERLRSRFGDTLKEEISH